MNKNSPATPSPRDSRRGSAGPPEASKNQLQVLNPRTRQANFSRNQSLVQPVQPELNPEAKTLNPKP